MGPALMACWVGLPQEAVKVEVVARIAARLGLDRAGQTHGQTIRETADYINRWLVSHAGPLRLVGLGTCNVGFCNRIQRTNRI